MKKSTGIKAISAVAGVSVLIGGCAAPAPENTAPVEDSAVSYAPEAEATVEGVVEREAETYAKVANVTGEFKFDQDVITPADDVFNLFGTAATAMCARPGFAFDQVDREDYYINMNGAVTKTATVSLNQLMEQESESRILKCSCATGAPVANAQVVGVPVKNIVEMVDLEEGANTITFKGDDGYGLPMPLSFVLENDALLVYQIDDQLLPEDNTIQLWMPKAAARYFTRRVTEIEFSAQEEAPAIADGEMGAKINVINRMESDTFKIGDQITFEGYADDYGTPIAAVEFSMDGGETWTACSTEGATADKWVYWYFSIVPDTAGTFKLDVRARTEAGEVSPLASSVVFTVTETAEDAV